MDLTPKPAPRKKKEKENKIDLAFESAKNLLTHIGLKRNKLTGSFFTKDSPNELSESEFNAILMRCRRECQISRQDFEILVHSTEIDEFSSIEELVSWAKLNDPKKGSIKALFDTLILENESHNELLFGIFRKFFIGFFAKILGSNHTDKNDILPVLIGNNSLGKTYFWKEVFAEITEKLIIKTSLPSEDDLTRFAAGNYLCILDDISQTFFKDSDAIKSVLTNNEKGLVKKYSNNASSQRLWASFVGTSNYPNIIFDSQFNRRIIPILIKDRDKKCFDALDKKQVFIEAYHAYISGEAFDLSEMEIIFIKKVLNKESKNLSVEDLYILDYVEPSTPEDGGKYLTATDIMLALPPDLRKNVVSLGKALNKLGFVAKEGYRKDGTQISKSYCVKVSNLDPTQTRYVPEY